MVRWGKRVRGWLCGWVGRLVRWEGRYRCYELEADYVRVLSLRGYEYDGRYIRLERGGKLYVSRGYRWNGCSPKFAVLGMVLGTPEGVLGFHGYALTYYPSLVHDVLYQVGKEMGLDRREVDGIFLVMLGEEGFGMRWVYWVVVRVWGGFAWG